MGFHVYDPVYESMEPGVPYAFVDGRLINQITGKPLKVKHDPWAGFDPRGSREVNNQSKLADWEPEPVPAPVEHPHYYNQIPGVECIDVVEHMNFNRGNAIKYIWRAGNKDDTVTDLEKAIWYLKREIERLK